jgi:hypothetical protein
MKHHGRREWQIKTAHLMAARKQREKKGQGQDTPFKVMSPVTYFL